MNSPMQTGLYGKLPAYGDFIFRNLNSNFINPWDEWLQNFISASQQQIGEDWLNIYLTSPIWRFVISSGVIDNNMWAGFMMPSVDRVGRYFPISVVKPFAASINPVKFISEQQNWYAELEKLCLSALEGKIDADQLILSMTNVDVEIHEEYQPTPDIIEMGPMLWGLNPDNQNVLGPIIPYALNAALTTGLSNFSLWYTQGSDLISPVFFNTQGLPPIGNIAAMLDGQWQQRGWKIPYNLLQQQ